MWAFVVGRSEGNVAATPFKHPFDKFSFEFFLNGAVVIAEAGEALGRRSIAMPLFRALWGCGVMPQTLFVVEGYGLLSSGTFCSTCGVTCSFGPSRTCIPTYAIQLG